MKRKDLEKLLEDYLRRGYSIKKLNSGCATGIRVMWQYTSTRSISEGGHIKYKSRSKGGTIW